jgi:hypothetical protein
MNPDIKPNTPLNIAYMLYPEIFLAPSDSYMTTLIEYMAATKRYKKICMFTGLG